MVLAVYGKVHGDMFTGSMMGTGSLSFAVMTYIIAHQMPNRDRTEFRVELRPRLLAVLIGDPEEKIAAKIEEFCGPDDESRSLERGDETGGRKLIKEGPFTYLVVNGGYYDGLRRQADKQESDRLRQAKFRSKAKTTTNPPGTKPPVSESETLETASNIVDPPGPEAANGSGVTAEQIYAAYPRKVGRGAALKKIELAMKTIDPETLLEATAGLASAWKGETDLQFCPHPATWFGQQRYLDSPETWEPSKSNKPSKPWEPNI